MSILYSGILAIIAVGIWFIATITWHVLGDSPRKRMAVKHPQDVIIETSSPLAEIEKENFKLNKMNHEGLQKLGSKLMKLKPIPSIKAESVAGTKNEKSMTLIDENAEIEVKPDMDQSNKYKDQPRFLVMDLSLPKIKGDDKIMQRVSVINVNGVRYIREGHGQS